MSNTPDPVAADRHRPAAPHVDGTVPSQWLVDEKVRRQDAEKRATLFYEKNQAVMAAIRHGSVPDGETEWEDNRGRPWCLYLETVVECPDCGFTFGRDHTDDTPKGGYTCPCCAEDRPQHYVHTNSFPPYVGGESDDDVLEGWQATCVCGWAGTKTPHVTRAHMEAIAHLNRPDTADA